MHLQQIAPRIATALALLLCSVSPAQTWQRAVDQAASRTPEARIVVLDVASGHLLAAHRFNLAAHTLAAPGSTLKPLVLYGMVTEGRWDPDRRIACNGQLTISGRRLACSHPQAPPFDAREALTWSCNRYFAAVARSMTPGELGRLLQPTGLLSTTGLIANEARAEFQEPHGVEAEELALLGVEGVRVTPLELAVAYRWLAQELTDHPDSRAAQVVDVGMKDSASFGMAGQASFGGVSIAGKTGTAESESISQMHGWFAGLAPAINPRVILIVFLPSGRGVDAAWMAGEILLHSPLRQP